MHYLTKEDLKGGLGVGLKVTEQVPWHALGAVNCVA